MYEGDILLTARNCFCDAGETTERALAHVGSNEVLIVGG